MTLSHFFSLLKFPCPSSLSLNLGWWILIWLENRNNQQGTSRWSQYVHQLTCLSLLYAAFLPVTIEKCFSSSKTDTSIQALDPISSSLLKHFAPAISLSVPCLRIFFSFLGYQSYLSAYNHIIIFPILKKNMPPWTPISFILAATQFPSFLAKRLNKSYLSPLALALPQLLLKPTPIKLAFPPQHCNNLGQDHQ